MLHDTQIQVSEIMGEDRFAFTTTLFGKNSYLKGEHAAYQWMRQLCQEYTGGYWRFFALSTGGCFMAPEGHTSYRMTNAMNWSDETISAQAAGIVVTLFALSTLLHSEADECLIYNYHCLHDFLAGHDEAQAMLRLID